MLQGSSDIFGERIYAEASERGVENATRVVVLSDGAAYNRTIREMHFPQAVHIVDLYHAREHLHNVSAILNVEHNTQTQWASMFDEGSIEQRVEQIITKLPRSGPRRKMALKEIGYFKKNAERMRYANFKQQGLFVGSGVIEAACRTVVCRRFKQPGMFWSTNGAHQLLQVRCSILSQRYDADWENLVLERTQSVA